MFKTICSLVILLIGSNTHVFAQQAKQLSPEELQRLISPGPEHHALAELVGNWKLTVKSMGESEVRLGQAQCRMTTGGRFMFIEYETSQNLLGTFTIGFDNRNDRFMLMATDSYGNYFVTSHGKRDDQTKSIRMLGTDDDPTMKSMGLTKEFLHVLNIADKDQFKIEVFFIDTRTAQRREIKAMELSFQRDKVKSSTLEE